jgi:ATP-dependent DNA helicase PIF1
VVVVVVLLQSSTYHLFLDIFINGQEIPRNEITNNTQVKTKLDGVEYIFLNEISIVTCDNNYKISSQLAKTLNESGLPYGEINMIFVRDFAQMSLVFGALLYNSTISTQLMSHMIVQS